MKPTAKELIKVSFSSKNDEGNSVTMIHDYYPPPQCFNGMIIPIVYQMKSFRKMKLGMLHNPELMAAYVHRLNSQGNISYESDFSLFDTAISNVIMK